MKPVIRHATIGFAGAALSAATVVSGRATPPRAHPGVDTVTARLDLEIGEGKPMPYSFGEVSGLAVDRDGRMYVSDFKDQTIAVFAPTGRLLMTIGRNGDGPGEFRSPTGPVIAPDGALFVRDQNRVTRFVRDSATGIASRYSAVFRGPIYPDWRSKRPSRVDRSGRLWYPDYLNRVDQLPLKRWILFAATGAPLDTVYVPPYTNLHRGFATLRLDAHNGRMIYGLDRVPFEPTPAWDVTPKGTVIAGDGREYQFSEIDNRGRALRRFGRQVSATTIDGSERRDSLRAFLGRVDSLPVPLDNLEGTTDAVRKRKLPETYPPYTAVIAAEDETIWVRRWPRSRHQETIFDVFSASGSYVQTIVLPASLAFEPVPYISRAAVVGFATDEGTDLPILLRFQVPRP